MGAPAAYDQDTFGWFQDSAVSNPDSATQIGSNNQDLASPSLDTTYLIRFLIQNTGAKDGTISLILRYSTNGGTNYNTVTTTSNFVRSVATAGSWSDGVSISQLLGAGTYDEGYGDENDGTIASFTLTQGQEGEFVWAIQFRSADITNETILLQVWNASGPAILDAYTVTPSTQFTASYTLPCDVGAFTLSGQDVGLNWGDTEPLDVGAFTLTGYDLLVAPDLTPVDKLWDDFDDNSRDTAKWDLGGVDTAVDNASVTALEQNGRLEIQPLSSTAGSNYYGFKSVYQFDLTNSAFFVEVAQLDTTAGCNTQLYLQSGNQDAAYSLRMEYDSAEIYMGYAFGGAADWVTDTWNGTTMRWWRIRYDDEADTIEWQYSADGLNWTTGRSVAASTITGGGIEIRALRVSLSAGTWASVSSPSPTYFDNVNHNTLIPRFEEYSRGPYNVISQVDSTWRKILWGAQAPACIIKFNGLYFAYVIGADGYDVPLDTPTNRAIGVFTSPDGLNWTEYGSNPIITYTTGGSVEEGVGGVAAVVVGSTIHLYYAAITDAGGGNVDLDIRYRSSTDGYTFGSDTLIIDAGSNEYNAQFVLHDGTNYHLYVTGPLTSGKGVLRRYSGTSPTSLTFQEITFDVVIGAAKATDPDTFVTSDDAVIVFDRRETGLDRYRVRTIDQTAPSTLQDWLFQFTVGTWGDTAVTAPMYDSTLDVWYLYMLDISGGANDGDIILYVYGVPPVVAETGDFALTGYDVALPRQYTLTCDTGNFTLTGYDVTLTYTAGYSLALDVGNFTLTGYDVGLSYAALKAVVGHFRMGQLILTRPQILETASGPASYTLTCDTGNFTLTGYDVGTVRDLTTPLDVGNFVLTGYDVGLAYGRVVALDVGAFTLTGYDVILTAQRTITVDVGTFTLTGYDVITTADFTLTLDVGTFTLTGYDLAFTTGYAFIVDVGSFTLTGIDVGLTAGRVLTADVGVFTLVGYDVIFSRGLVVAPDVGTFILTGYDLTFTTGYAVVLDVGALTLTGIDVTLTRDLVATLDVGVFALTGYDVNLVYAAGYTLIADEGVFVLTGNDVILFAAHTLTIDVGSFVLTGIDVTLTRDLSTPLDTGSFTFTGEDVNLVYAAGYTLIADTGVFTFTGYDVDLFADLISTFDVGNFVFMGYDVGLASGGTVALDVGNFTFTGYDTGFVVDRLIATDVGVFILTSEDTGLLRDLTTTFDVGTFTLSGQDVGLFAGRAITVDVGAFTFTGQDIQYIFLAVLAVSTGAFVLTGNDVLIIYSGTILQVAEDIIYANPTPGEFIEGHISPSGEVLVNLTPSEEVEAV